jgi:hypothetical protein
LVEAPTLVQNPNPSVPLAAVLRFTATEPVATELAVTETKVDARTRRWSVRFAAGSDPAAGLPLVGFRGDADVSVTVTIRDRHGGAIATPTTLHFKTPPLPEVGLGWPRISVTSRADGALEPGVTIVSARRRAPGRQAGQPPAHHRFSRLWGVLIGLDPEGDTVWYYLSEARIAGVQALDDGRLMMTLDDQRTRIIDMLGNTLAEYAAEMAPATQASPVRKSVHGVQTLHHSPCPTRWGTYFSMSASEKTIPDYFTSVTDPDAPRQAQKVVGDSVVEFDKDGKVLWQWSAFDHLDTNRIHYSLLQPYWKLRGFPDALDWSHGNGVTYDDATDTLIMTFKQLDAVIGVAYPEGKVRWILSDPRAWPGALAAKVLKPKGAFVRYPFSPHHPHVTPHGTVVLYDNGMFQAFPFDGQQPVPPHRNFSRGVEVRIDLEAMTFEEVWTSESAHGPDSCYNWAMGEALYLPETGNLLAIRSFCPPHDPSYSDFDEFDLSRRFIDDRYYGARLDQYSRSSPARLLARIEFSDPNELVQWQLYGGVHLASPYWGGSAESREVE